MKIAIIGAGHMGSWFASELIKDDNEVAVFDLDPQKTEGLFGIHVLHELRRPLLRRNLILS